jgi:protein-L-isoaspartate(D-aspartate) O-methyltransferase
MSKRSRRKAWVAHHIAARGVRDPRVLAAMADVRRELFVPADEREAAYADRPLSIGHGQTISQPFIVAYMIEALQLRGDEKVLEIGAGSGYAAAVLSRLSRIVYTIETIAPLAAAASERLGKAGYENVHVRHGDGTLGWPEHAPYDAILVSAGAPHVPPALLSQLADAGRMVIPVGSEPGRQLLVRIVRHGDLIEEETLTDVHFVPLVGRQGWPENGRR